LRVDAVRFGIRENGVLASKDCDQGAGILLIFV
jgi:hypothetical protein